MSAKRADLHVHTNCSDGLASPEEVIDAAIEQGITHIAITDHDTMDGVFRAQEYLASHKSLSSKITLIPGVEVSSTDGDNDVHMLGYFIEDMSAQMKAELFDAQMRREVRSLKIADALGEAGYPISSEILVDSGQTINRTSIARLLMSAGAVSSVSAAYETLIGTGCPFHIERDDMKAVRALKLISDSGGLSVIAHPALYGVAYLIESYAKLGLCGVEAYHSEQTLEEARHLALLADSYGLLVTGGSDWHQDPVHPARIGETQLPEHYLESFLAADPRIK